MTRRGQQAKQAVRRAVKEVAQFLGRTEGDYVPPPREECDGGDRVFYLPVSESSTVQIVGRAWRQEGRLRDFFLELQRCESQSWQWETVMRADICHGHAHTHRVIDGEDHEGDPQHVYRLDKPDDVDEGYARVVGFITEHGAELASREEGSG